MSGLEVHPLNLWRIAQPRFKERGGKAQRIGASAVWHRTAVEEMDELSVFGAIEICGDQIEIMHGTICSFARCWCGLRQRHCPGSRPNIRSSAELDR